LAGREGSSWPSTNYAAADLPRVRVRLAALLAALDLYLLYAAYVMDVVLFALRVARTTYLKKIAVEPSDITPTISLGITIDQFGRD